MVGSNQSGRTTPTQMGLLQAREQQQDVEGSAPPQEVIHILNPDYGLHFAFLKNGHTESVWM